jgi:hypothetical protein
VSLDDITNPLPYDSDAYLAEDVQFLPSSGLKFWEVILSAFQRPATRSRNIHLAVCAFMAAVTDCRSQVLYRENPRTKRLLQDVESDSAAAKLMLPAWYTNAAQSTSNLETPREHQLRLHSLLVWGW